MEASQPTAERVIEPPKGWSLPDLRELWEHRDLVYFLARRDIAVRYKQSLVGPLWAMLQPVLLAAVFTVVFDVLAKVDAPEGIPYSAVRGLRDGHVAVLCDARSRTPPRAR